MLKKKIRTYQDYRELGSDLYAARMLLLKASLKSKSMFGKSKPEGRILEKVLKDMGEACVSLDKCYGRDIPDDADVPQGEPICPLYPASFDDPPNKGAGAA